MSPFSQNLAHFTNGIAVMFFILTSIHLYKYKGKNHLMKFLYWEMIFFAFLELTNIIYLAEGVWETDYLPNISLSFDMWGIPLTMVLMFEIISPGWIKAKKLLIVMLPSFLFTLAYILLPSNTLFYISVIYANVLGTIAIFIVFGASSRYDNYIKKNFSYTENLSLYWVRWIITPLYLALFTWTLIIWEPSWLGDAFYYIFIVIIWMFIFHYVVKHAVVEVPNMLNPFIKETKSQQTDSMDIINDLERENKFAFGHKLNLCMEKEMMYLDAKLTITDLAIAIGTNRTYLSDYLNKQLDTNFYEYINIYRIKRACAMLESDCAENIEVIAEACGFNSLSTFRRSFLKETGETPLQYKKKYYSQK